jgi:aminomethyltransferase
MTELRRTPLHDKHVALGARMVAFADFEMPVSYSGIIEEHRAVRERVGLFDVSHMGEFIISGTRAIDFLDRVVTNDCSKLSEDGVLYTVMCRDDGTAVDDLLVTRLAGDRALVVVNAANIEKDFGHMKAMLPEDDGVALENASDRYGLLAVQGPNACDLLKSCPTFAPVRERFDNVAYYRYFRHERAGDEIIVSRTGYTGEKGFEILVPAHGAPALWDELTDRGADFGLAPVGLAARDTLRFEASYCLYGHELDDDTTPLEAGLEWVVKFNKPEFRGRAALAAEKERGSKKKLAGLELDRKNIARQGYPVMQGNEVVGKVTSGTFSPTLNKSLCLAYIDTDRLGEDQTYEVQIRKKVVGARRVPLPFYSSRAR